MVLIDAPTAAKALKLARIEAKESRLKGQRDLGVFDLAWPSTGLVSARGTELVHFTYRSNESAEKFVCRRFESAVCHARKPKRGSSGSPDTPGSDPMHAVEKQNWTVVRSLHCSKNLRLASRKTEHIWVERFAAFDTGDMDEALEWATADDELYSEAFGLETYPLWEAFLPFEPLQDGVELFSILRESRKSSKRFMNQIAKTL
ncbi:hypothetical protein GCM10027404_22270 [Arthrobacter tumbae]